MSKRLLSLVVVFALAISPFVFQTVKAATLTSASVTLSDSRVSQTAVSYSLQFSGVTTAAIKCIKVAFSDSTTGGAKPTGLDITSAAFSGTSNYIPTPASWAIANNNATGISQITFATGETPASAATRTVVITNVTNGSVVATSYFIQFSTYNNTDCSTSPVDSSVIAFIYTNGQVVSATVDPTLSFTIAGVASGQTVNGATTNITTTNGTVPFGTLSTGTNKIGAHDLTIGTNAQGGYTVTVKYTGALTATAGTIADHTGTNAAPTTFTSAGTESFGYTTNDVTLGTGTAARFSGNKWAAFTTLPLEVAYNAAPVSETIRVGYQAGIASTTKAGTYTTTVIYVATPTY